MRHFIISLLAVALLVAATGTEALRIVDSESLNPFQGGVDGKLDCNTCKASVKKGEDMLTSPMVQEKINDAIGLVCPKVAPDNVKACETMATHYVEEAIQIVKSEATPTEVCKVVGACDGIISASAPECKLCSWAANEALDYINDKDAVKKVSKLCDKANGDIEECKELVAKYLPLLQMLVSHIPPSKVCSMIHVCPNTDDEAGDFSSNPLMCIACKKGIDEAKKALQDPKTISKALKAMEEECDKLPFPQCKELVQKYGKEVVTQVADKLDADKMCAAVELC